MATRNFKIKLRNANRGKITKELGLITIGDAPDDITGDPPTTLNPENLNEWECVWENTNNANIFKHNVTAEIGYEYIVIHIAGHRDWEMSSARFWFHELEQSQLGSHIFFGQGPLDDYVTYQNGQFYAGWDWRSKRGGYQIKGIYRRPFKTIAKEEQRLNPGEFEILHPSEITQPQFRWEFDYEYVFAIRQTSGDQRIFYNWIYGDKSIMSKDIDKYKPFLMANNRKDGAWMRFRNASGGNNPTAAQRTMDSNNYDGLLSKYKIHSVYRRPTELGLFPDRKPSDRSWHRVFTSPRGVGESYFNWKEGKEYLIMGLDSGGDNEGTSVFIMTPPNGLAKFRHNIKNGYVGNNGDGAWFQFSQSRNGRNAFYCKDGAYVYDIYERDAYFDPISCAAAGAGPVTLGGEWTNSQIAINAYEVSGGTGYRDNVFYLIPNSGIDANKNFITKPGVISLVVRKDTNADLNLDSNSQAFGVVELARFNDGDGQRFKWTGTENGAPTAIDSTVNATAISDSFDVTANSAKFEVTGLGNVTQAQFEINLEIEDAAGNTEVLTGLKVIVNKTLAADGGSVYVRSDELL